MIIVDTSAIIAVLTNEQHKQQLINHAQDQSLVAPSSLHWEIGNAFSAMMKRGRINFHQVCQAMESYANIPIRFVETDLMDALDISNKLGIYAYDAYMLACATKYRAPLLTLDSGLASAAQQIGIKVLEIK